MLVEHPNLLPPDDSNVVLWRYVDLAKFLSLITGSKLAFVRADLLGDNWEGAITTSMSAERDAIIDEVLSSPPAPVKSHPFSATDRKRMVKQAHFSCWRMSDTEDASMWAVYGDKGIAIRSTCQKVLDALPTDQHVHAGVIEYVDYDTDDFDFDGNLYSALMHKRIEFRFDQELRFAVTPDFKDSVREETIVRAQNGEVMLHWEMVPPAIVEIPANLHTLIDEVVLSPLTAKWLEEPVRRLLKAYDLEEVPLRGSRLAGEPTF